MATRPKCFGLMPFDEDGKRVFRHAIRPAAEAAGFECVRADDAFRPEAIIRNIVENIFKADVIVADISKLNPNVLYELGIAHSVGNKTIMICEDGEKLPFNLSAYRVVFYEKTVDGIEQKLRETLEKTISDLPNWGSRTNPVQDFRPVHYAVPLLEQAVLEKKIENCEGEKRQLKDQIAFKDLRATILGLPEMKIVHLRNLISAEDFKYNKIPEFLDELRALRSLKLIRPIEEGMKIRDIPADGKNLKLYLEVTEPAREVLEELTRLFSSTKSSSDI